MEFHHTSVLRNESVEGLAVKPGGIYLDGTLGGCGHSLEIARLLQGTGLLIGVDQDENAILHGQKTLLQNHTNVCLVHSNFSDVNNILKQANIKEENGGYLDGVLLDLGVSSHQLDEPSRGFSYMHDAPLDMRMDNRQAKSAYDVVNTYNQEQLTHILYEYGEERWAQRVAEFIIEERREKPITTTFELVTAIKKAIPKGARTDGPHPAKRTFQAIRIEVNGELALLEQAIYHLADALRVGGRICIITFHSLEDRIVKNAFRTLENPCTCPRDFPVCMCHKTPSLSVITKKPILPSETELENNHRARSAKLRIAQRI